MTETRRMSILRVLSESLEPVTGTSLALQFKVSRQAIVQDIAVLRAAGYPIIAASNGYFLQKLPGYKMICRIPSSHIGEERMEEELKTIVDHGGKVLNIIVNHPIYGEIVCPLSIRSREDIRLFLEKLNKQQATPLSILTEGVHAHDIEVDSAEVYDLIYKKLMDRGFITHV